MRRYRFRLESALRARRAQEDVARQRLAEANHRLRQARAVHEAALDAYRSMVLLAAPADRDTFLASRAHEVRMAEAVERTRRTAVELEVESSMLYSAWVEAAKRVASLERLDERRREEWHAEVRREEASAIDDVVASRWSSVASGDGAIL